MAGPSVACFLIGVAAGIMSGVVCVLAWGLCMTAGRTSRELEAYEKVRHPPPLDLDAPVQRQWFDDLSSNALDLDVHENRKVLEDWIKQEVGWFK